MKFYIALALVAVATAAPQGFSGNFVTSQNTGAGRQSRNMNPGPAFPGGPGGPLPAPINPFKAVPFQSRAVNNFIMPGFRSGATNPYAAQPKVYGMGLNNQFARPHNIFEVNRAIQVVENNADLLVRVDMDGDVQITNRFGMEVEDLYNAFGQDITDF